MAHSEQHIHPSGEDHAHDTDSAHHGSHDHGHSHGHSHGHHHHHGSVPSRITRAFIIGIVLNSAFVITEVVAGLTTHSLALLTDAGHNLSDVASLTLALLATKFALRKASPDYTFGYKQSTVLVALLNAGILLLALGAIAYDAIMRISDSPEVEGKTVAAVATAGIVINAVTALLFLRDKDQDLNLKGAYLHMAADALVSLGVVIGGVIIVYTHWYWLDSAISLIIVVVVVYGTWGLLKESFRLSLNGVPGNVDMTGLRTFFLKQNGITEVHDLHVWALSTTENALTVHVVIPGGMPSGNFYENIREELKHHFNINHSTIQVEPGTDLHPCDQKC